MIAKVASVKSISVTRRNPQSSKHGQKKKDSNAFRCVLENLQKSKANG